MRKSDWRIAEASAPGAEALIDDERNTAWRAPAPSVVTLDLGQVRGVSGFTLLPAWDRPQGAGAPAGYRVSTRLDDGGWTLAGEGEFANIAASLAPQRIAFGRRQARYFRLEVTRAAGGEGAVAFAELGVITDATAPPRA